MPGVKVTEPMHGFVFPQQLAWTVGPSSEEECFFEDAPLAFQDQIVRPQFTDPEKRRLFADFVEREGVASCARIQHFDSEKRTDAVLWVNYSVRTRFSRARKAEIRGLFRDVLHHIPQVWKGLAREPSFPAGQLDRILQTTGRLATEGDLLSYLDDILAAALEAFNIRPGSGYGSIFLLNATDQTLVETAPRRAAASGARRVYHILGGEGVVSWVALRRRSILIPALKESPFYASGVYVATKPDMESELAVPMMAADELLGVLNLESSRIPTPFSTHSVRAVWHAANQAAVACRLARQTESARKLLQIAHDATVPAVPGRPLDEMAQLASALLGASRCDIWEWRRERFADVGASYGMVDPSVALRANGWSAWVLSTRVPVWISEIREAADYNRQFWNSSERRWEEGVSLGRSVPAEVNSRVLDLKVHNELGLPILVGERCLGVAWVKFDGRMTQTPSESAMSTAEGFAAEAGLVMDVLQHHKELADEGYKQAIEKQLSETLLPTAPLLGPGVDGYVINHPCGASIGGDFYASQVIDQDRTCFLIGDGEGHGRTAALFMLPMLTMFSVFSKESCTPKHTLWKLLQISDKWKLRGTALCFIVDVSGEKPMLFASSAGHLPLMIIKENLENVDMPQVSGDANWAPFGACVTTPKGEESRELEHGDVIIAYTDGVKDAGGRTALDREGIAGIAVKSVGESAQVIAELILNEALARSGGEGADDMTVMVLRVNWEASRSRGI